MENSGSSTPLEQAIRDRLKAFETNLQLDPQQQSAEDPAALVTTLVLDGRKFRDVTASDANLLLQFPNLTKLSCNQTGLCSLVGFPQIPSLRTFEATDNHLSWGIDALVTRFPNLKRLELGGNFFKTFDDLGALKFLPFLTHLGLELNPVTEIPSYREKLLECLPKLQILDAVDRMGNEHDGEDDVEEEYEEEDDEGEDGPTLKDFYEKDYSERDDDDDDEEFEPGEEDEDEEIDEEEDNDEAEGENDDSNRQLHQMPH